MSVYHSLITNIKSVFTTACMVLCIDSACVYYFDISMDLSVFAVFCLTICVCVSLILCTCVCSLLWLYSAIRLLLACVSCYNYCADPWLFVALVCVSCCDYSMVWCWLCFRFNNFYRKGLASPYRSCTTSCSSSYRGMYQPFYRRQEELNKTRESEREKNDMMATTPATTATTSAGLTTPTVTTPKSFSITLPTRRCASLIDLQLCSAFLTQIYHYFISIFVSFTPHISWLSLFITILSGRLVDNNW